MGRRSVGVSDPGPCVRPRRLHRTRATFLAIESAPRSVAVNGPRPYKSILSYAIMVEKLMHWLVADRHGIARASSMRWISPPSPGTSSRSRCRRADLQSPPTTWCGAANVARTMRTLPGNAVRPDLRCAVAQPEASALAVLGGDAEFTDVDYLCRCASRRDNVYMEQWRGRRFRSTDRLAPVLPIVLYIGNLALDRRTAGHRPGDAAATQAGGGERRRGGPTRDLRATATCCLTLSGSRRRI